jgi:uncharacterized protein YecT (DUF1311 family)
MSQSRSVLAKSIGICIVMVLAASCREEVASAKQNAAPTKSAYPCGDDPRSLSQMGMNECASRRATEAEGEMFEALRQIRLRYAKDALFLAALEQAQSEWLRFRNAEMAALFPEPVKPVAYGSMYNMCAAMQRRRLIQLRTAQLRLWLDGEPETRGCSGSLP